MDFGYFTLSDNRYPDNKRTAEQFLLEIRDQAVYAEEIGMHSAWIGEHHFNRRGCVPVPGAWPGSITSMSKVTYRFRALGIRSTMPWGPSLRNRLVVMMRLPSR